MILGIDVSEFQGKPDYGRVKASGVEFVISRVNYGAHRIDNSYLTWNKSAVPGHGLLNGAYSFLVSGQDVRTQADFFCQNVDENAAHFLDVELRQNVDVEGWVNQYRQHFPMHPLGIYTGRDLWHDSAPNLNGGLIGPLWVAGYLPNAYVPAHGRLQDVYAGVGRNRGGVPFGGWSDATLMQFTDNATIPGISGAVDGDVFYGDSADWLGNLVSGIDVNALADAVAHRILATPINGSPESLQEAADRTYQAVGRLEVLINGVNGIVSGLPVVVSQSVNATIVKYFGDHPATAGVDVHAFAAELITDISQRLSQNNSVTTS